MADEVVPVEVPQRRGAPLTVARDEGIRPDTSPESLAGLRPAFRRDGTITAGNASQISDGASAVVVMSRAAADARGVTPLGEFVGYGMVAGPDNASLLHQPSGAIKRALDRAGLALADVDLFEINEAFACVAMFAMKDLGISHDRINVNGGATALGHPIGASGTRILVTLVNALKARGLKRGVASLCIGGGEATAVAVELV